MGNGYIEIQTVEDNRSKVLATAQGQGSKILTLICNEIISHVVETAPREHGTLRRSFKKKIENNGSDMIGTVYSNVKYAPYQELGTGIYYEGDKNVISNAPNGKGIRKGRVRAKHFLRDAVLNHLEEYKQIAQKVWAGEL